LNLYVDIGNSRIKLASDSDNMVTVSAYNHAAMTPTSVVAEYKRGRSVPARIIVSNVAGEKFADEFNRACDQSWGITPEYISVSRQFEGVTNGYKDHRQLGVDRWLAIIAAWHKYKTHVCVVDCGSAVTIDFISAQGEHSGGYIIPGNYLMQQALANYTSQLKVVDESTFTGIPGRSTEECISNGTLLAVAGFIDNVTRTAMMSTANSYECLITGGGAGVISKLLTIEHRHEPQLVLEGIRRVIGA